MVLPHGIFHFFQNQLRESCSTGRASESWGLGEPWSQLAGLQSQQGGPQSQLGGPWIPLGRPAIKQAAALGGPRIKPGEPWSQPGGPQSQLGGPQSQLREPQSQLGGPQSIVGGPGKGGGKREKERSFPGMWWYHRSSSPTGPLPKSIMRLV